MTPAGGYVVVNGIRLPIVDVTLAGGYIKFLCRRPGPVRASDPSPMAVTLFGADDVGVCQGLSNTSWRKVRKGEFLDFVVTFRSDTCYGDAEVPDEQAG